MGIIAFGDRLDDWHAANWVVRHLLRFAEQELGAKTYLASFQTAFDHGYNIFDVADISRKEAVEFASVTRKFLQTEACAEGLTDHTMISSMQTSLAELVQNLEQFIASTQ